MLCEKCKTESENVLELYDGTFACPHCKEEIKIDVLQITDANDELFTLSEIVFHNALKQSDNKTLYTNGIARAVAMCRRAAYQGHPKAVVRLAYYYEMGYGNVNALTAFKVACNFYKTVWSNSFTEATLVEHKNLRKIAAYRHLGMLERVPANLQHVNRYSYDTVLREMKKVHALPNDFVASAGATATNRDDGLRLTAILDSCLNETRAPLFGLIAVKGSTLVEWAHTLVRVGKKDEKRLAYYLDKGSIALYLTGDNVDFRIKSVKRIPETLEGHNSDIEANEVYYLVFFNEDINKFSRAIKFLMPNYGVDALLQGAINKARKEGDVDYVFYPDDVLKYREMSVESIKHAVKDLLREVAEKQTSE